jgi:serine/threonine protein kinase/Tol biopolymer transport system component
MAIEPGTRLGHYEILAPLGRGGMGEVYRARDTRLDRIVAIKLLPADTAVHPESRQRLHAEARAVSLLNHPNVCALYDIGCHDGIDFLVMELLQGETLATRLQRGPIPFTQLVRLADEMTRAVDAAHAQGIVHRDLKPSNVMLTKTGVKLLDFGIAKVQHAVAAGLPDRPSDTRSFDGAQSSGRILGTLAYMAPEQLEGQEIDQRVDIFALGAILYEMATGRPAFGGRTEAGVTAAILEREPPPPSSLEATIPPAFDRLVRRCLAKDPDERWQSARDLLFQLKELDSEEPIPRPVGRRILTGGAWSVAALSTSVAVGALVWAFNRAELPGATGTFHISLPPGVRLPSREVASSLAVSPDGGHIVFAALRDGRAHLWLRSLNVRDARLLPATEEARHPFWSPDSRFIGFYAAGKLQRLALEGGLPHVIWEGQVETTPTWGPDGTILFARLPDSATGQPGGIYRIPANGGSAAPVTTFDPAAGEIEHYWPSFLPDGVHFLYSATISVSDTERRHAVYVGSIADGTVTRVADVESRVTFASPGYLFYAQDGGLLARRFDLEAFRFIGDPHPISDRLWYFKAAAMAEFSVSDRVLAYHDGTTVSELAWFDRAGRQLETLGQRGWMTDVRISPNGRSVSVATIDARTGASDIWLYDRESGIPNKFTADPIDASWPVWSADGRLLYYRSAGSNGPPDIYQKRTDGRGERERRLALPGVQYPADASLDGRYLVYGDANRSTVRDIWLLPLSEAAAPVPYLRTPALETDARVSPNSRWLAFVSNESGGPEIYVAPIDNPRGRQRISIAGGFGPRWRHDGREIVYLDLNDTFMSVALTADQELKAGVAQPLFSPGRVFRNATGVEVYFDLAPDGQSLLVNRVIEDPDVAPITVVLDWSRSLN